VAAKLGGGGDADIVDPSAGPQHLEEGLDTSPSRRSTPSALSGNQDL
jgi:hypothetical protein